MWHWWKKLYRTWVHFIVITGGPAAPFFPSQHSICCRPSIEFYLVILVFFGTRNWWNRSINWWFSLQLFASTSDYLSTLSFDSHVIFPPFHTNGNWFFRSFVWLGVMIVMFPLFDNIVNIVVLSWKNSTRTLTVNRVESIGPGGLMVFSLRLIAIRWLSRSKCMNAGALSRCYRAIDVIVWSLNSNNRTIVPSNIWFCMVALFLYHPQPQEINKNSSHRIWNIPVNVFTYQSNGLQRANPL